MHVMEDTDTDNHSSGSSTGASIQLDIRLVLDSVLARALFHFSPLRGVVRFTFCRSLALRLVVLAGATRGSATRSAAVRVVPGDLLLQLGEAIFQTGTAATGAAVLASAASASTLSAVATSAAHLPSLRTALLEHLLLLLLEHLHLLVIASELRSSETQRRALTHLGVEHVHALSTSAALLLQEHCHVRITATSAPCTAATTTTITALLLELLLLLLELLLLIEIHHKSRLLNFVQKIHVVELQHFIVPAGRRIEQPIKGLLVGTDFSKDTYSKTLRKNKVERTG